ncbi:MAG: HAD hydrolase-like protein [Candidatus Woesearchaeota archaeon]
MIKGIIFDYDGTIAQTLERQERWLRHWAEVKDKKWPFFTYSEFQRFYNEQLREGGLEQIYRTLDLPFAWDKSHEVWEAYDQFKAQDTILLYPGITEVIQEISGLNLNPASSESTKLRIGLNSSNTWKSIGPELSRFDLTSYFDSIVTTEVLRQEIGGDLSKLYKPSTASVALMLRKLGTRARETVHIGDTLVDLCASHQVRVNEQDQPENLITIGVSYGFESREILDQGVIIPSGERVYFDYVVDRPPEIVPTVRKLMVR